MATTAAAGAPSPAKRLAPLQIPQRSAQTRGAGRIRDVREHSQGLAVAASTVIVLLVAMEVLATEDPVRGVNEWRLWAVTLVFPSNQVTWVKIVCLVVGFVLTTSYFLSSRAQLASAEQLMIHSATVLVSPLKRKPPTPTAMNDPNAATPTGTTTAAWLASRCQSLLHTEHFGGGLDGGDGDGEELPQLKIRDECKPTNFPVPLGASSDFHAVNGKQPIAFDSEYFEGHVLFMAKDSTKPASEKPGNWSHIFAGKKRMLWVQVQGRFKKPLPPRAVLYLATELPEPGGFQVAFLTRQLVSLLITLVKTFVPSAHIAFGEKASTAADNELPHAAFPLFQTVDELVVTTDGDDDKVPSFGAERFGETPDEKRLRVATPVGMEPIVRLDAVYSFQFYTMYPDLAQWKIVNVPGMPDMDLKRFCGGQPIRLAVYALVTPGLLPSRLCDLPHKSKDKGYVLCFSMHHRNRQASSAPPAKSSSPVSPGAQDVSLGLGSPMKSDSVSRPPSSPLRWRSVSCDQPDSVVRQQNRATEEHRLESDREGGQTPMARPQPRIRASSSVQNMTSLEKAADLSNWKFSLPVWIERVDPAAGNRKVAYLFVVDEKTAPRANQVSTRRCVVRSAQTVKNALLLLDASETGKHAREFKKLIVESREFLYETISRETDQVAQALQAIAAIPAEGATDLEEEKKAMLFNCLMSESQLTCIRSYQDIGVQLTQAKREQMDIILEKGIYRMADPRFLRQEWLILTTTELHFFRSFSIKPSKTIHLSRVLSIKAVDDVPFFQHPGSTEKRKEEQCASPRQLVREAAVRSTNRWFCVEIQILSEIATVFFDCEADRALCVSSLNQLIKLKSGASSSTLGRLPPSRPLEILTAPLCCNQRKGVGSVSGATQTTSNPVALAEELVQRGLQFYGRRREDVKIDDVVVFLDAVERLNEVNLFKDVKTVEEPTPQEVLESASTWYPTNEHRVAFALNLFHALYIHAWLLVGDVENDAHWKKLKGVFFYAIGNSKTVNHQVRLTLAEIEFAMLLGQSESGSEYRSLMKSVSAPIPSFLKSDVRDFRVAFALQSNCGSPSIIRIYHAASLQAELNETCAIYLEREVIIDDSHRIVYLPKICEWYTDDFSSSAPAALGGSRAFSCLQKLLPMMKPEQHDRVHHLLLGAGKECRIKYKPRFWTQELAGHQKTAMDLSFREASTRRVSDGKRQAISSDDNEIKSSRGVVAEAGDGIPRSKSALQFLQSFF